MLENNLLHKINDSFKFIFSEKEKFSEEWENWEEPEEFVSSQCSVPLDVNGFSFDFSSY